MKRADDFAERRKHIANLTDEELYNRFWELTDQVVDPLLELGRKNTTPSVERSVLLRMGVSSLDCMPIVNHAKMENISIRDASIKLAKGEGWDKLVEAFKGGKK